MKEQFLKIHESRDKEVFLHFLKNLTDKQKKELIPILKTIPDYGYLPEDYIFTGTCLVCCQSAEQFTKLTSRHSKNSPELTEVLHIYCPFWWDEYIESTEFPFLFNYTLLLDWIQKDLAHPSELKIGESLGYDIYNDLISIKEIEAHPVTLNEHIWYVFKNSSVAEYKNGLFINYLRSGVLDRNRVLECSLCKNSRKFYQELNPQPEEIREHQEALFEALESEDTLLVHIALQSIRKIIQDDAFRMQEFIQHLHAVVHITTKKIVSALLTVLEEAAKKWDGYGTDICRELIPIFLNKDEKVQKKATSILCRYGDTSDKELKEKLWHYHSSLLQSVQQDLKDFLGEEEGKTPSVYTQSTPEPCISDVTKIAPLTTFEDYLFYLSALPNTNEPYLWELLPSAIKQFDAQITSETVSLLQNIFLKGYAKGFDSEASFFQHLYYLFLIEYGKILQQRYPQETGWMEELYMKQKEKERTAVYAEPLPLTPLKDWPEQNREPYKPLFRRIMYMWEATLNGSALPFLATPTHTPGWIDPEIFLDRLEEYQKQNQEPNLTDLEVALARCVVDDPQDFLKQSALRLNIPYQLLLEKWYNETVPALQNYARQIHWEVSPQKVEAVDYKQRYPLCMQIPSNPFPENTLSHAIVSTGIRTKDMPHILWSYPSLPEPVSVDIISYAFRFPQGVAFDTWCRDKALYTIQTLAEYPGQIKEMTGLFLACSFMVNNKNILDYGTAIWIEKTTQGKIDNYDFGMKLGKLFEGEWVTPKRLADNLLANLINISVHHNRELEELLIGVLSKVTHPISNLITLLEVYREILLLNNSKANLKRIPQLKEWQENKALSKTVKQLIRNL